jgi:hypothetical protein
MEFHVGAPVTLIRCGTGPAAGRTESILEAVNNDG